MNKNIEYIKEELSYQERFLESTIKLETLMRKYKKLLIAVVVIALLAIVGYNVNEYLKTSAIENSNRAYLSLIENPNDKVAKATLKSENPKLYSIFLLQSAVSSKDTTELNSIKIEDKILNDLKSYQVASLSQDLKLLSQYSSNKEAILKDLAVFQEAFLLIESKKFTLAKSRLAMIDFNSPLRDLANYLQHYLITKG